MLYGSEYDNETEQGHMVGSTDPQNQEFVLGGSGIDAEPFINLGPMETTEMDSFMRVMGQDRMVHSHSAIFGAGS